MADCQTVLRIWSADMICKRKGRIAVVIGFSTHFKKPRQERPCQGYSIGVSGVGVDSGSKIRSPGAV